jgi:hypothetical protein
MGNLFTVEVEASKNFDGLPLSPEGILDRSARIFPTRPSTMSAGAELIASKSFSS